MYKRIVPIFRQKYYHLNFSEAKSIYYNRPAPEAIFYTFFTYFEEQKSDPTFWTSGFFSSPPANGTRSQRMVRNVVYLVLYVLPPSEGKRSKNCRSC